MQYLYNSVFESILSDKNVSLIQHRLTMQRFFILLLLILLTACAKQGMPPGGPEDKTPPRVVETIPLNGQTSVDPSTQVEIKFSENLRSPALSAAVFISPFPGEGVKYKWRGKKLSIKFPSPLLPKRTYVVTLGTGLKDYRNNAMDSTFILAFSTGEALDRGEMTGQLYMDTDASGVDVWAYQIKNGEDPDPLQNSPDYIVQCEKGGRFQFTHLTEGRYRLFVIRDLAADRLYQPMEDEIGLTFRDVALDSLSRFRARNLSFRLTREDTLGPALTRVRPLDRRHVVFQFNEEVLNQDTLSNAVFSIMTENWQDTVHISEYYQDPLNKRVIHIYVDSLLEGITYQAGAEYLSDLAGNMLEANNEAVTFEGSGKADTTGPSILEINPAPNAKMVALDKEFRLIFNEWMDNTEFPSGFHAADTSGHPVDGKLKWLNPAEVIFTPETGWKRETMYRIALSDSGITDITGNSLADTVFQFQTMNPDTLSEISGQVIDPDTIASGPIFIQARQLRNPDLSYELVLDQPGAYRIKNILPGQYRISAFRDEDRNGKYSYGKVMPYHPAERFIMYADTIGVRTRWPNEGNNISLP